jgi:hypothetical protein
MLDSCIGLPKSCAVGAMEMGTIFQHQQSAVHATAVAAAVALAMSPVHLAVSGERWLANRGLSL